MPNPWDSGSAKVLALGPGLPEPMPDRVPSNEQRHSLPVGYRVVKRSVLGGIINMGW